MPVDALWTAGGGIDLLSLSTALGHEPRGVRYVELVGRSAQSLGAASVGRGGRVKRGGSWRGHASRRRRDGRDLTEVPLEG